MEHVKLRILVSALMMVILSGCGDSNLADLKVYVDEVKARPKGTIQPLPEFKPYEIFQYSVAGLRAPFTVPVEVELIRYQREQANSNVKPDENRVKEYLEGFNIDALRMVGTLAMSDDNLWALVDDSQGGVHRVRPGNFVGRNHGKVLDIDVGQIDVIEIVPDGHGGWLERPRSIRLEDES